MQDDLTLGFHLGEIEDRLDDLGEQRLRLMDETGVDGRDARRFLDETSLDEAAKAKFASGNRERLTGGVARR